MANRYDLTGFMLALAIGVVAGRSEADGPSATPPTPQTTPSLPSARDDSLVDVVPLDDGRVVVLRRLTFHWERPGTVQMGPEVAWVGAYAVHPSGRIASQRLGPGRTPEAIVVRGVDGGTVATVRDDTSAPRLSFSRDGSRLIVLGDQLGVWRLPQGTLVGRSDLSTNAGGVVSPDGRFAVIDERSGRLGLYGLDDPSDRVGVTLPLSRAERGDADAMAGPFEWSRDSRFLSVRYGFSAHRPLAFDMTTRREIPLLPRRAIAAPVTQSPETPLLACDEHNRLLRVTSQGIVPFEPNPLNCAANALVAFEGHRCSLQSVSWIEGYARDATHFAALGIAIAPDGHAAIVVARDGLPTEAVAAPTLRTVLRPRNGPGFLASSERRIADDLRAALLHVEDEGSWLVTWGEDGSHPVQVRVLSTQPSSARFTPDGQGVVLIADERWALHRRSDGTVLASGQTPPAAPTPAPGPPPAVNWAAAGPIRFVEPLADGRITVLCEHALRWERPGSAGVGPSVSAERVYSTHPSGEVVMWRPMNGGPRGWVTVVGADGQTLASMAMDSAPDRGWLTRDGARLAVVGDRLYVWAMPSGTYLGDPAQLEGSDRAHVSPDGRRVAVDRGFGALAVFSLDDPDAPPTEVQVPLPRGAAGDANLAGGSFEWSRDSRLLSVEYASAVRSVTFDVTTGRMLGSHARGAASSSAPDGGTPVLGWDAEGHMREISALGIVTLAVPRLHCSPDSLAAFDGGRCAARAVQWLGGYAVDPSHYAALGVAAANGHRAVVLIRGEGRGDILVAPPVRSDDEATDAYDVAFADVGGAALIRGTGANIWLVSWSEAAPAALHVLSDEVDAAFTAGDQAVVAWNAARWRLYRVSDGVVTATGAPR